MKINSFIIVLSIILSFNTISFSQQTDKQNQTPEEILNSASKNNYNFYSPEMAYYTSFIPFWSGSWNAEFNNLGCLYQPFKLFGTFLFGMGVYMYYKEFFDDDYGDKTDSGGYFGWGTLMFTLAAITYLPFAYFDAVYSKRFVIEYNKRIMNKKIEDKTGNKTNILPFLVMYENSKIHNLKFDGIGFLISKRF